MGDLVRILGVALSLLLPLVASADGARFIPLGDLPGGRFVSVGLAVSPDGFAVAGQSVGALGDQGFLWTEARGMEPITRSGGRDLVPSVAQAVSALGSFVAGIGRFPGSYAFRWSPVTGAVSLGVLPAGTPNSQATAISSDGSVVVGHSGGRAFRWTEAQGMTDLGICDGSTFSDARGISADGEIVIGACGHPRYEAFRWTRSEGIIRLGMPDPGYTFSAPFDISPDGSTIVGIANSDEAQAGFRWTQSEGTVFFLPEQPGCIPEAVSEHGAVIVVNCRGAGTMLWDAVHGPRDLVLVLQAAGIDPAGWKHLRANGISDDGSAILGNGVNPDGNTEAWLAILPADADVDAVEDDTDRCLDTPAGEVVDPRSGCSVFQRCPCDRNWKSRGRYLSCVADVSARFVRRGLLDRSQRRELLRTAAQNDCGKRR